MLGPSLLGRSKVHVRPVCRRLLWGIFGRGDRHRGGLPRCCHAPVRVFLDPDKADDWQRNLIVLGVLVTPDPLAGCVRIGIPRGRPNDGSSNSKKCLMTGSCDVSFACQ